MPRAGIWHSSPTWAAFRRCGAWPKRAGRSCWSRRPIGPRRSILARIQASSSSAPTSAATSTPSCSTPTAPGNPWRALTDDPDRIHTFGSFSADGGDDQLRGQHAHPRWFDIYVRDLATGEVRCVLEHDSTNHAGPFSPDGRWLIVVARFRTRTRSCGWSTFRRRARRGC